MCERVIITANEGKIRGILKTSEYSETSFYSFYGVPYGEPPIGNLRFKDPVKVKPWRRIYDATKEKPGCIQYSLLNHNFWGTEDCLYNNIHIPKLPQKDEPLRAIIVNIHPGAYNFGTPNTDQFGSPDFIMHHDVVYICIAYRLHILGFLNLGIKDCSGNQAIKDIILGLRWIKSNIKAFGGDPDNITVIGSSTGAILINILMLSPAAKDLFHKAVLMGGYVCNPVMPHQNSNQEYAYELAKLLGCTKNVHDHKQLLAYLKSLPAVLLIQYLRACQKIVQNTLAPIYPMGIFSPTLDHESGILPESPRNLLQSMAKIPIMVGFCERESILGFSRGELRRETEENFKTSFCQNCWSWGTHLDEKDIQFINQEVESFYTQGTPIEEAPLSLKVDIQTDITMSDVYETLIDIIAADSLSSVFVYKFEFEGAIATTKTILLQQSVLEEDLKGTYHNCDYFYWNRRSDPENVETREMVDTFTKLVTTFAKTSDPNNENIPIRWIPSTLGEPCYLSISNPIKMVDGKLNNERLEFWDRIKQQIKKTKNVKIIKEENGAVKS
ncbi:esterase E4-like [Planococcus citri]|uniref:esterase E4-like n=1 Tax=Planococcus citri TaxID=170843 RepID=UPI0031F97FFD